MSLDKIYKRLFSEPVLLKSEVIELGLIDDFVQALDNMVLEPSGNIANKVLSMKADLNKNIKDLETILTKVDTVAKIGMNVEKSIKDLGLEMPSNYKSAKDRLFTKEVQIKKALTAWQSAYNSLVNPS